MYKLLRRKGLFSFEAGTGSGSDQANSSESESTTFWINLFSWSKDWLKHTAGPLANSKYCMYNC
jgi:hypothetical protein